MKLLTRPGALVEDMGQTYLAEPDADGEEARTLRPLQAATNTCRNAFGPRHGQKVLKVRGAARVQGTVPSDGPMLREGLAHAKGVRGLHGMPRNGAARQPRAQASTPWRDGTKYLVMIPLEFMQRPAAPVPRPQWGRTIQPDSGRS